MSIGNQRIAIALYVLFIGWTAFFSYTFYLEEEKTLYRQIDNQLSSIASGATMILPNSFQTKVYHNEKINKEQDETNINRLTRLAESFHVAYIYTAMVIDGNITITASSVIYDPLTNKRSMPHFGSNLRGMDKPINDALKNKKTVFDEAHGVNGVFKCAIVPITTDGVEYVSVAGIDKNALHLLLRNQAIKYLLFALGIVLVSLPLFIHHYKEIKRIAFKDNLTKLPNRFEFQNKSSYALNISKRSNQPFAVMYLDLDGFKQVNDTFGHSVGDELLIQVSNRLVGAIRKSDIASRHGGDEFVILLPDTELTGAKKAANKILEAIADPYTIGVKSHSVRVTFSIGIALFPSDGTELDVLSKKADAAMYEAKAKGKNCFMVHGELSKPS